MKFIDSMFTCKLNLNSFADIYYRFRVDDIRKNTLYP